MRLRLALLLLIFTLPAQTQAQENEITVVRRFIAPAPPGYAATVYSDVSWSPDSSLLVVSFHREDENRIPVQTILQLRDAGTGALFGEFESLLAWYADSSRLLIRPASDFPPQVIDSHTGEFRFSLPAALTTFDTNPIHTLIAGLDAANTLYIYDAVTGEQRFALPGVTSLPRFSPDQSRFAVNLAGTGIRIYEASTFALAASLDGYGTEENYFAVNDWSPDGQQLVVMPLDSTDRRLGPRHIWIPGVSLSAPIYNITSRVVWSPDRTRIAAPSDYTKVRLYDSASGELLQTIRGFDNGPTAVISWTDEYLSGQTGSYVFMDGQKLYIWDFERGDFAFHEFVDIGYGYHITGSTLDLFQPLLSLRHWIDLDSGETLSEVNYGRGILWPSPDQQWALTGGATNEVDGVLIYTIDVYRLNPFSRVTSLGTHSDIPRWSPDSRYLTAKSGSEHIIVWELVDSD